MFLVIVANAKDAGQYFANFPFYFSNLTLGRARKFIPPPWYKGGGGGWNPPKVFDILQYFETILPSVESLWSSLKEVYFMGGGAAGGPVTSPTMVAILDFTKD